jgi:hypothetical protein
MKYLLFSFFILTGHILSQEYQITTVPVIEYSIDRYTNEIYYQHEFTGDIYKTNSTGTQHSLTNFPSLPQFANNSHTAAFVSDHNLYLHDFEKDTSYFLAYHPYIIPILLFSPSDDKILCGGESEVYVVYYSFEDNSVHNTGVTIYPDVMEWSTDTTIVYVSLGGFDIRVLNINDLSSNTLVPYVDTVSVMGLSSNYNINAFAYSYTYNVIENTLININYPNSGIDSTVYNFNKQGPFPGGNFRIFIRDLTWEKKSDKLAFIGEVPLVQVSLIYVFEYSTFNTYLYSDPNTTGEGNKYNLQWLNKDTVIYSDYNDNRYLFGLDVTMPVSVRETQPKESLKLDVQSFPNPFNINTKIAVYSPLTGGLTIELYDCLGKSLEMQNYDYVSAGTLILNWEELKNNKNLSSGIYFIRVILKGEDVLLQKTIKLIYLK